MINLGKCILFFYDFYLLLVKVYFHALVYLINLISKYSSFNEGCL